MIDSSLKSSKIEPGEIDLYSVTYGPGSFTGIRIGLSIVKAMAFANNKPCVGVSSLAALARNCLDSCKSKKIICVCVDARCGGVYNALFEYAPELKEQKIVRLCEDRAIVPSDLISEIQNFKCEINFVGDGSQICYNLMRGIANPGNLNVTLARSNHICASKIAFIAKELYAKGVYSSAFNLLPNYIKIPQAERLLKENKLKIK